MATYHVGIVLTSYILVRQVDDKTSLLSFMIIAEFLSMLDFVSGTIRNK